MPVSDAILSAYLTGLHEAGKAPATYALHATGFDHRVGVCSAAAPGPLAEQTPAGIRREGRTRGRGKVKGAAWAQAAATVQVAVQASLSGLRDAGLLATMSHALLRSAGGSTHPHFALILATAHNHKRVLCHHSCSFQR